MINQSLPQINVVICDDDSDSIRKMQEIIVDLEKTLAIAIDVICFTDGESLKRYDLSHTHILFLDIRPNELNGLEIASEISLAHANYKLIIVSEVMSYAVQGYEVDTYRYIVKSNMQQALPAYFTQAIRDLVFFREKRTFTFSEYGDKEIFTDTILYIESLMQRRVFYCTGKNEIYRAWKTTLQEIQEALPANEFVRIHRSLLANVRHIKDVENMKAILSDGTRLDVTASREKEIRKEIFLKKGRLKIELP